MSVGSLFSGIGGIELGLERAGGFETKWFVEWEPYCQDILRKHWPKAKIYADVTKVDFTSLSRVDVLTGGFPCQDISNAGKRAGITGSRSGLWSYCVEAIRVLRPRICFFENVSAIINRGLDVVLADLASVGYDAEWHCVSASSVGAPHRRDRIILLCWPADVAYSCVSGLQGREESRSLESGGQNTDEQLGGRSNGFPMADTHCEGVELSLTTQRWQPDALGSDNGGRSEEINHYCRGWWSVEPRLGRVAYGIPNRVHRIKALGNAVVPAFAQAVGETIKKEMK